MLRDAVVIPTPAITALSKRAPLAHTLLPAKTLPQKYPGGPRMNKTATLNNPFLVMVIDDNPNISSMLVNLIEAWGFDCISSNDPKTGIAIASEYQIGAFVLDIRMPGMDGYELGAALQRKHLMATFIANTGEPRDPKREQDTAFFFHYFLQKPNGFMDLRQLLPIVRAKGTEHGMKVEIGQECSSPNDSLQCLLSGERKVS